MPSEFQYDVFLSHNSGDKPRVRKLADRLKQAGLRVWFDEWNIRPGDDIYLAIERGLESSRTLVLCLSPSALGSNWVGLERNTVLFRDPANTGRRLIPLLLSDCNLPDALRRYKYLDYREESEEAFLGLVRTFQPSPQVVVRPTSLPIKAKAADEPQDAREARISEFQKIFADYIYGPQGRYPTTDLGPRRILAVDDDTHILELWELLIRKLHPNFKVIKAKDGVAALEVFRPGAFALVITDVVMPRGVDGWELAEHILASDPDVVVVAVSGYSGNESEIARFYELGGFRFHQKPFPVEIIRETLDMALNEPRPRISRWLNLICSNPGNLLQNVNSLSESVHFILSYATKEGHIAHSLLRHKLKHIVAGFLKSVGTETDIEAKAQAVNLQAQSLCRLTMLTAKASGSAFPLFLRQYVKDLKKEHPWLDLHLRMEASVEDAIKGCSAETILALVACELLDNAINAVSDSGSVSMNVAHLQSTQQLSIIVHDSGPGVAQADIGRLFQQGFSTKGEGRGLGLHLIREAVYQLGGKITYKTHKGACFSVVIPIDKSTQTQEPQ